MSSRWALRTWALLVASATGLGGCGQDSTGSGPPLRGIAFPVTYSFSGATMAAGSFTDIASQNTPTTCGDYGREGIAGRGSPTPAPSAYFVPAPPSGSKLNGERFAYESLVEGYHGPGNYADPHILVALSVGGGVYTAGPDAMLQLDARADGSGSVQFSDFTDVANSDRTVSGRIDWTCRRAG